MGGKDVSKLSENRTRYTELRTHADELLKYVSFASAKELEETRTTLGTYTGKNISSNVLERTRNFLTRQEQIDINEKFLGDVEPIPLHSEMERINPSFQYSGAYKPFSNSDEEKLKNRTISLVYHDANKASSNSSVLTDISALFCSIIPATEMSLCVPYFDMKIIYPWTETSDYPRLDLLKFSGGNTNSLLEKASVKDTANLKYGYDVVGMEIFGIPQTLSPTSDFFKTSDAYKQRGIDVLDPISPLLTLNNVNMEQIGVGGGLNIQSKVTLNLTLHDRSRLSDIEPLVSSNIFPFTTFRITYGWHHPDTNKMSGNVYAKFLNSMRVTQDYSVVSVSIASKSSSALGITITLSGAGTQISKSAKIISSSGKFVPYSAVDSLVRQFITLKSKSLGKNKSPDTAVTFERVGTTVISSLSSSVSRNKFVPVASFYQLYSSLSTGIKTPDDVDKIKNILTNLLNDPNSDIQKDLIEEFNNIFQFELTNPDGYDEFSDSVLLYVRDGIDFVPESLRQFVLKTAKDAGYLFLKSAKKENPPALTPAAVETPSEDNFAERVYVDPLAMLASGSEFTAKDIFTADELANLSYNGKGLLGNGSVIPLSEMISHLVAKPLLISQPDLDEVRIHCFSFNSACGRFAEENIGNFPIVKSKFINYLEEKEKDRKISANTTVDGVLTLLTQHVNDPSSPFYGFSTIFETSKKAAEAIKEALKEGNSEELQLKLEDINKDAKDKIDKLNESYLTEKNINLTDSSYVPARVKTILEILPAYENKEELLKPTKKIARIIVYDERCGGFDKLGNLLFSMINSNGIARVNANGASLPITIKAMNMPEKAESLFTEIGKENSDPNSNMKMITFTDKRAIREVASNLYPTLIIGSEGSTITNASYSSAPSGDIQSSYLLTALQEQNGTNTGASAESTLVDDVFILPATVRLSMLGNTCIVRGQTYYVDFYTGTTLDNSYTVTSVSHNLSPGTFKTEATLMPTNSASMKSVQRQVQELILKVKNAYSTRTSSNSAS